MTDAETAKPLLLVDVDGVLNPFTAQVVPHGFDEHNLAGMKVLLSPVHGEWLRELSSEFELVWATTWEADANALIGPLIGLPTLPFITFTQPDPTFEGYTIKLPDVIAFVGNRRAAWIDDDLSSDVRYWSDRCDRADGPHRAAGRQVPRRLDRHERPARLAHRARHPVPVHHRLMPRPFNDPYEEPATEPDLREPCAICGRELWSDALPPALDGEAWICGDCDQARNFEALDP